mmetsp:Transcript_132243/g.423072  ORF Transcript_132243/g.423072 Transcript_132243/m.423072 type:complete len:212 (-) Transcript_132243:1529-2164(-)
MLEMLRRGRRGVAVSSHGKRAVLLEPLPPLLLSSSAAAPMSRRGVMGGALAATLLRRLRTTRQALSSMSARASLVAAPQHGPGLSAAASASAAAPGAAALPALPKLLRRRRNDRGVPSPSILWRGAGDDTPGIENEERLRGLRGVTTVESGFSTTSRCQGPRSPHRATISSFERDSLSLGARNFDVSRLCRKIWFRCRTSADASMCTTKAH